MNAVPDQSPPSHIDAIRGSVFEFTQRDSNLKRVREARGQFPGYSRNIWSKMAELGLIGTLIPEEQGGLGLGLPEAAAIAEELAKGVVPEPFSSVAVLAVGVLLGSDNAKLTGLLPQVAEGSLIPAVAWQEQPNSIDPRDCDTKAADTDDGFVLSGRKRFIIGADAADGYIVSAKSTDGLGLFWVPKDSNGVKADFKLLSDGRFDATLILEDVHVTQENLIAPSATGASVLARALDTAILIAGAELLGLARRNLAITLEYLRTREQFGKPIGSFQALQHRAVDCHVQVELAAAVLSEALGRFDDLEAGERAALASRVKARCAEAALMVGREAIQMHGAMGFTDDCDVGLYSKRALCVSAWLGGVHTHRRRFASLSPVEGFRTPQRSGEPLPAHLGNVPADSDWNSLADDDFRLLIRHFAEENYPQEYRYLPRRVRWHEVRDFYMKLGARGWGAPSWPRAWGGMGLTPGKQLIYIDEMERWGVGRAPDQGIRQLGPVLMRYGTEEQKAYYLPKILAYEHIWAQGYSEPGAGSDLASLTTSAVVDGDEFVINGSKIWTTLAEDATHIYVLCRTDKTVKKQAGISFIIVDLNSPGITMRPIRNIAGDVEFNQVFFDNVRAPAASLVGKLNDGWSVAKVMLGFERLGIGSPHRPTIAFNRLTMLAREWSLMEDPGFVDDFTRLRLNLLDHGSLYMKFADMARQGQNLGDDVSLLKIWGMENFQRISEFLLDRAGSLGAEAGMAYLEGDSTDLMAPYYMSRLVTIGGGSNEIQRNIIAKRVLQLPG